jgi:predicted Zn-dependent protease
VLARVEIARTDVALRTQKGLRATWPESRFALSGLVVASAHGLDVARTARTRDDASAFDLALADAAADLQQLALATSPVAGPCAIVLGADALLHGDGYGVWDPFVAQADALRARQGLDRYRLGMPVAPGADTAPEPLSIISDGTLDYGLMSAPLDDDGIAIRRFPIVEGGIAVGLGVHPRDAAFLKSQPNGGVRNLVVATGTWADAIPDDTRVVEIRRLRDLAIDPYTGDATLEIALAIDHQRGTSTPIGGGTVRLDLIAALSRARRSSISIQRGPYRGPRGVLLEHAELIA